MRRSRTLRKAKLDNLALVPGSLLPFKEQWQVLANRLPAGSTLIILPSADSAARRALEKLSSTLNARGRQVSILLADTLLSQLSAVEQLSLLP